MDDAELGEYRRLATRDGLTLSEWVRQKLRLAAREGTAGSVDRPGSVDRKLAAIRAAAHHDFPTAGIDRMLCEFESGYRARS